MSQWTSVISGVPQGLILGPSGFDVLLNNTDSRIRYTLSKAADNTKPRRDGIPSRGTWASLVTGSLGNS